MKDNLGLKYDGDEKRERECVQGVRESVCTRSERERESVCKECERVCTRSERERECVCVWVRSVRKREWR